MKYLLILLSLFSFQLFAQEQACHVQTCRSQLIRLELDSEAITEAIQTSTEVNSSGIEALRAYFNSDLFKESFITSYPIDALPFPHNSALCHIKQQDGNQMYQGINCEQENFCASESISESVRSEVCFSFPCSFFMGDINKCPHTASSGAPTQIKFPGDIKLKDIKLTPQEVNIENNQIRGCFSVDKLDVDLNVLIDMKKDPVVDYQSIGLEGLELRMNEARRVCVSADLDLTSSTPISNVKIEKMQDRFVSNNMIDRAVENASLKGLDGYSEGSRRVFRLSVLKPMARHFQDSIEGSIQISLASAFEEKLATYYSDFTSVKGPYAIETPQSSFVSELGVSNMMVSKYADLLECSILKSRGESISNQKCLSLSYSFGSDPLKEKQVPNIKKAVNHLKTQFNNYDNITSETLKNKLQSLKSKLGDSQFKKDIVPLIETIARNQQNSRFMGGIELFTNFQNQQRNQSLGVGLQGICNTEANSPHLGKSMAGCAMQVYVDTNEFNRLIKMMYEDGRMCHRGRGDFVPQLDSSGEQVYKGGFAQGSGCELALEEKANGMRCYLNGPPQLEFDPVTKKYKLDMKTKECYRGPVFAGQGRLGGDIDFEISYNPSVCEGGDLCLQDGTADWNVVPGTARGALRGSSFLNGIVHNTINEQLTSMLSDTMRLSFSEGVLANLPIKGGSKVDRGTGFFGLCLELKN